MRAGVWSGECLAPAHSIRHKWNKLLSYSWEGEQDEGRQGVG